MRSSVLAQGEESCWSLDVDADNSPHSFSLSSLPLWSLVIFYFSLYFVLPCKSKDYKRKFQNISVAMDIYVGCWLVILVANSSDCIELEAHTLLISGENKAAELCSNIEKYNFSHGQPTVRCITVHREGYSLVYFLPQTPVFPSLLYKTAQKVTARLI